MIAGGMWDCCACISANNASHLENKTRMSELERGNLFDDNSQMKTLNTPAVKHCSLTAMG
jgi:hypothetical protein